MNYALWIVQGLLALFFILASGAPKLIIAREMPNEQNRNAAKVRKLARPLSEPFLFFMLS